MITCKDGDIMLDGSSEDLLVEAASIVVRVIQGLVEEGCVDAKDVPKIINGITQAINEYTKHLVPNKSTKYN